MGAHKAMLEKAAQGPTCVRDGLAKVVGSHTLPVYEAGHACLVSNHNMIGKFTHHSVGNGNTILHAVHICGFWVTQGPRYVVRFAEIFRGFIIITL